MVPWNITLKIRFKKIIGGKSVPKMIHSVEKLNTKRRR